MGKGVRYAAAILRYIGLRDMVEEMSACAGRAVHVEVLRMNARKAGGNLGFARIDRKGSLVVVGSVQAKGMASQRRSLHFSLWRSSDLMMRVLAWRD